MGVTSMTIGRRVVFGYALLLFVLVSVGAFTFWDALRADRSARQLIAANRLVSGLAQSEAADLLRIGEITSFVLNAEGQIPLRVESDDRSSPLGRWLYGEECRKAREMFPELAGSFARLEELHRELHRSGYEIHEIIRRSFAETAKSSVGAPMQGQRFIKETVHGLLPETRGSHDSGDTILTHPRDLKIRAIPASYQREGAALDSTQSEDALSLARAAFTREAGPKIEQLRAVSQEIRRTMSKSPSADEVILDSLSRAKFRIAAVVVAPTIIGLFLAFFVSRGINRNLRGISDQMDEAAGHMDATSYEVSSASQSLAEGATEQATILADTFIHLEDMAAISKQNALSAGRANALIHASSETVESASESMLQLTTSMMEISEASEETQKIIKAIDEVAFQTNLLALNAAVEAARAGEAGAGFAVVAQEVRNLAARAAEAARRTAHLIEDTVGKVGKGVDQVRRTSEEFSQIASSIVDARDLMADIAASSDKQARGVDEINKAITEVNRITQENASNAEVTASVSDELTEQGKEMRDIVGKLISLVVGNVRLSEQALGSLKGALRELVNNPQLRDLDKYTHQSVLNRWLAKHPEMEAVYSNDAEGYFIYSEPPAGLPNAGVRPWWQRAMAGAEYVSPVYISAITRKACCTLSFPLRAANGDIVGVLGVDLKVG